VQYPQSSFPQFSELEIRKPFRIMMMEIQHKNLTNAQLQDRLCKVVDYILLPACTRENMMLVDQGCNLQNLTQSFKYEWKAVKGCKGGIDLPAPIEVPCSFVPTGAGISTGFATVAAISIVICILNMGLLFYYRGSKVVKSSSYSLTMTVLIGALISEASVFLMSGDPAVKLCGIEYWVLGIGFMMGVGALLLKVIVI
jgi:hypothetical protein